MTLLTVCQEAAIDIGLTSPASIATSTGLTEKRLLTLANQAGRDLMRWHEWQDLTVSHTFTTLATQVQTGALPTKFDRLVRNPKIWNRSTGQRLWGPTPQRYWQQLVNSGVTGGIAGYWRIIAGELNVLPVMTAGQTLSFEYINKNFALSAAAAEKSAFTVDTDTFVLDEHLLTLDIVWRFCKSRGFARYAEDLATFEREKERLAANDRGVGNIRTEDDSQDWPPQPFWNGTIG